VMMDWLRKMGCATESVVTSILGRMFFRLRCGASAVAPQSLHEVSQSRRVFPTTISLLLQTRRNSTIYVVSRGKVNHRRSSSPGRILLIIFNERDVPFSIISQLVSQLALRMLPLQSYYRSNVTVSLYDFVNSVCKSSCCYQPAYVNETAYAHENSVYWRREVHHWTENTLMKSTHTEKKRSSAKPISLELDGCSASNFQCPDTKALWQNLN
jgi:hypothetical protein